MYFHYFVIISPWKRMEGQETDYNASAGGGGEGSKVMDDDGPSFEQT